MFNYFWITWYHLFPLGERIMTVKTCCNLNEKKIAIPFSAYSSMYTDDCCQGSHLLISLSQEHFRKTKVQIKDKGKPELKCATDE